MSSIKKPKSKLLNTRRVASVTHEDSDGLKRNDSLKRAFFSSLEQFLLETSLHGMKHIAKKHYHDHDTKITARIKTIIGNYSWIIATLSGALFSLYMMNLVWVRFSNTPTVTTVETINNPISEVAFPAVTVCNINKVHYTNTKKIREILKANDIDDDNIMSFLGNLSRLVTMDEVHEQNVRVEYLLERLGHKPEALMREFILGCNEMLSNCSWLGVSMPCNRLFRMIKSSQGFCCSFNYHGLREIYDINYDNFNMSHVNGTTEYVSGAGEYVGLIFKVDTKPHHYTSATENYQGAEVIIHNAMDFPDLTTNSAVVQPGEDLRIAVQPEIIVSQSGIRSMDVEQRDCWFEDEHDLILAKQYTFESCMAECRAAHNIAMCHCMMYMFPLHRPAAEDGYIRQCGMRDLFCLRDIRHILFSLVKNTGVKEENVTGMDCNCLPSCSTTLYKLDSNVGEMINDHKEENAGESIVYVFFKDLTCLKYRRDPFMNWDSLFASFGGIFGLCLGGSIISLIEIFYFLTFKFYTNLLKFRHEFRLNYLKNLVARKANDYPVLNVADNMNETKFTRREQTFLW